MTIMLHYTDGEVRILSNVVKFHTSLDTLIVEYTFNDETYTDYVPLISDLDTPTKFHTVKFEVRD